MKKDQEDLMISNSSKDASPNSLIVTVVVLLIVGLVMVFSASYIYSKEHYGSATFLFYKQLAFVISAVAICVLVSKTKISFWLNNALRLNLLFTILVIMTLIPGIGINIKGSSRWINLYFSGFQPGELIKYSVIISSVYFFNNLHKWKRGEKLTLFLIFSCPLLGILLQPDFGTFGLCLLNIGYVCYLSRFPRKWFYGFLLTSLVGMCGIVTMADYRMRRLTSFLDPWADPSGAGFQVIQSYLAFARGRIFGQGLGNGHEKLFYLPEAHNDFILSVLGEELGFIGVCFIVLLFLYFCISGLRLARNIKKVEYSQIVSSLVFSISIQAFLNMGVVLGLLPTKGLNLPFISYGGSSMISLGLAVGMILSSAKENREEAESQVVHQIPARTTSGVF